MAFDAPTPANPNDNQGDQAVQVGAGGDSAVHKEINDHMAGPAGLNSARQMEGSAQDTATAWLPKLTFDGDQAEGQNRLSDSGKPDSAQAPEVIDKQQMQCKDATVTFTKYKDGSAQETIQTKDGTNITISWDKPDSDVQKVTIADRQGNTIEMTPGAKGVVGAQTSESNSLEGVRRDQRGNVTADVQLDQDKHYLISVDRNTGKANVEKVDIFPGESDHCLTAGQYDANEGTFTSKTADGHKTVESIASDRKDLVNPDGSKEFHDQNGTIFLAGKDGGAEIKHVDGSKESLVYNAQNPESSFVQKQAKDGTITQEPLSPEEKSFLKEHPEISDRRDILDLHEKFHDRPEELAKFYGAIKQFDSAQNITKEDKSAFITQLVHQAARPQEISQGRSPDCPASSAEKVMAISHPDKMVNFVYNAVENQTVMLGNGQVAKDQNEKPIKLNRDELMKADTSEKDLLTRTFQNAYLKYSFAKYGESYSGTADGGGTVRQGDKVLGRYGGFGNSLQAEVNSDLTGDQQNVVHINKTQDLYQAWLSSGRKPMVVAVDGTQPPITDHPGEHAGNDNHVVVITGVYEVPGQPGNYKVALQSSYGLNLDHSEPGTWVDGQKLVNNMMTGDANKTGGKLDVGTAIVSNLPGAKPYETGYWDPYANNGEGEWHYLNPDKAKAPGVDPP